MKRWILLVLSLVLVTSVAWGGTYLDRATLLVIEARRASQFLRQRSHDKELARVVHQVALARLEAAQKMTVPKEVVLAHPHVLIVLEHHERAAEAAADGNVPKFLDRKSVV